MKHQDAIFNVWAKFHIAFIVLICVFFAYDKYAKFYKIKAGAFKTTYSAWFFNKAFNYYGKLTGAGSSYGFFAPNVRVNGVIIGDCGGQKITAKFNSYEAAMRFSVLSTRITNNLLEGVDTVSERNLDNRYMNLLFKSIGVKLYNQHQCAQDTMYLSYNLMVFPTLTEYAAGHKQYYLIKLKETRLTR